QDALLIVAALADLRESESHLAHCRSSELTLTPAATTSLVPSQQAGIMTWFPRRETSSLVRQTSSSTTLPGHKSQTSLAHQPWFSLRRIFIWPRRMLRASSSRCASPAPCLSFL